ncbi:ComF family protein [Pseudoalteromonas mariniglutinosa]|uniref:ComF family protein n=1 Tax=Pseudoalteromonas mariniglutinosa TaxID=206042 RepID=UPI003850A770
MNRIWQPSRQLLNCLFPNFCVACHGLIEAEQGLCQHCLDDLVLFDLIKHHNLLHRPDIVNTFADCRFDHLIACAWYQAPFKHWLKKLKFSDQIHYKKALQQVILKQLTLAHRVNQHWPTEFIIMPLHNQRYLQRGYNQVSQTWLPCLNQLNLPISNALIKNKATQPQSTLSKAKRVKNLKGAFICQQSMHGKTVAIIDDVMTSGATLNAATEALKHAGAKQVWALLTCLTPLHH